MVGVAARQPLFTCGAALRGQCFEALCAARFQALCAARFQALCAARSRDLGAPQASLALKPGRSRPRLDPHSPPPQVTAVSHSAEGPGPRGRT